MKDADQGNSSWLDRFLFAPADPVMVGAVRIGLALLLAATPRRRMGKSFANQGETVPLGSDTE